MRIAHCPKSSTIETGMAMIEKLPSRFYFSSIRPTYLVEVLLRVVVVVVALASEDVVLFALEASAVEDLVAAGVVRRVPHLCLRREVRGVVVEAPEYDQASGDVRHRQDEVFLAVAQVQVLHDEDADDHANREAPHLDDVDIGWHKDGTFIAVATTAVGCREVRSEEKSDGGKYIGNEFEYCVVLRSTTASSSRKKRSNDDVPCAALERCSLCPPVK